MVDFPSYSKKAIVFVGFGVMEEDHCMYIKRNKECLLIISLYFDNILLIGNTLEMLVDIKVSCPPFLNWRTWVRQSMYLELESLEIVQRNS